MSVNGGHRLLPRLVALTATALLIATFIIGTESELRRIRVYPPSSPGYDRPPKTSRSFGGHSSVEQPKPTGLAKGQFVSSKVKVTLGCESDETVVSLNFTAPFRGVVLVGDNRSPCRVRGNAGRHYVLRVPHEGCGTKHVVESGSFFNTLFIRYHPSLEMEGDQLKTIVCKFGTASLFVG